MGAAIKTVGRVGVSTLSQDGSVTLVCTEDSGTTVRASALLVAWTRAIQQQGRVTANHALLGQRAIGARQENMARIAIKTVSARVNHALMERSVTRVRWITLDLSLGVNA